MTPELWISVIQFAVKFGIDAAIAIVAAFKPGATLDDAIAALELAKTKSADDYLAEAQAAQGKKPEAVTTTETTETVTVTK